jgi:hypothetical protein
MMNMLKRRTAICAMALLLLVPLGTTMAVANAEMAQGILDWMGEHQEASASPFLPPGHGGTPPGQGGTPPGQQTPPGKGGIPPGQQDDTPGGSGGGNGNGPPPPPEEDGTPPESTD